MFDHSLYVNIRGYMCVVVPQTLHTWPEEGALEVVCIQLLVNAATPPLIHEVIHWIWLVSSNVPCMCVIVCSFLDSLLVCERAEGTRMCGE